MAENKMKSRKFIVWLTATAFLILSFVVFFLTKETKLTETFAESWGWISAIYIGGNVAQKFVNRVKND